MLCLSRNSKRLRIYNCVRNFNICKISRTVSICRPESSDHFELGNELLCENWGRCVRGQNLSSDLQLKILHSAIQFLRCHNIKVIWSSTRKFLPQHNSGHTLFGSVPICIVLCKYVSHNHGKFQNTLGSSVDENGGGVMKP